MTWLAPTAADRTLVDQVEARSPALYRLGLVLAPALRVEPLLLRNARLRFLPQSDAGLESDLWFSPLVGSRSARSVLLRPGVARILADRLETADTPPDYANVWQFVGDQTRNWSFEDRLEQAMRQFARHGNTTALRDGLRTALRRIAGSSGDDERRDLARWLKGALPALMGGDQGPVELDLTTGFAAAALGDPGGTLGRRMTSVEALPEWLQAFVPSGKVAELGLRLWPGVLEILPPDNANLRIELGAPSPAPVHIHCENLTEHRGRWEPCWAGRRIALPPGCTTLTLTTLTGARYRLAAKPGQRLPPNEPQHPAFDRPVLVAHYPEDSEAAKRVLRLLESVGIEASLIPESAAAEAPEPEDAFLLRLWTQTAHRRSSVAKVAETIPVRGVVLRMDDAPLLPGAEAQDTIDLSAWRGDPEAETARELLRALRGVADNPGKKPKPQPRIRIYINYRRSDSAEITGRLYERLRLHFGPAALFMDVASIAAGQDWMQTIDRHIQSADIILAIIGPRWLTETDAQGRRRLDDPNDMVRVELSTALNSAHRVVPVLIDEAPIPREVALPEDLSSLSRRQGVAVRSKSFDEDLVRLIDVLERIAKEEPQLHLSESTPVGNGASEQSATQRNPEIERLLDEIDNPETLPQRRLAIGDRLAELGDPRPGVGLTADGLPDIDWVEVPGGDFLYREQKVSAFLDAFRIARYPVTNTQYQAFIDAGGYRTDRWWVGLAKRIERPLDPRWTQPNRPRTEVSWYEAVAFCRWLSSELAMEIRLPTEIEWEKSARGADGRNYPWGDEYLAGFANIDETKSSAGPSCLNQTTAVGVYPHGASPCGALDLAGNVREWCLNKYEDQRGSDTDGVEHRVLRGGSWFSSQDNARSAGRDWDNPISRNYFIGFRVLCSSPIVDD